MVPTPPPNRMTDACDNITFPQLRFRAVKTASRTRILAVFTIQYSSLTASRTKILINTRTSMEFEGDSSVWPWNLVLLLDRYTTLLKLKWSLKGTAVFGLGI